MTTTIETFKFTQPMPTTSIRTLTDERVYKQIIDQAIIEMGSPNDADNEAAIVVKIDNYFVELEISFSAYYQHDYERFDFGYHDFGGWKAIELYDIDVKDCHKTYEVNGDEFDIDLALDTNRIMNAVNNYFD